MLLLLVSQIKNGWSLRCDKKTNLEHQIPNKIQIKNSKEKALVFICFSNLFGVGDLVFGSFIIKLKLNNENH